ncbi:hypothetical protein NT6N_17110 [Oceaniferula spumae]|uniref:Tetratricopeptide repeat protein n=1 Tax=Oceaniferula spumae TaxID=2979115 RepID=A0AAT9FKZ4_9BACT
MSEDFAERKEQVFYHWLEASRYDKAIEAGHQAIAENPEADYLHASLGHAYLCVEDIKRAKHHLETSLSLDPENSYARSLLALTNMRSNLSTFSKVERQAIETLSMDPDNFSAWEILARTTVGYDERFALQCCDRLIQLYPDNSYSYVTKAHILQCLEKPRTLEAGQMLGSALVLAPDDASVHYWAAEHYYGKGGDKKRAEEHLKTSLQIDPTDPSARELAAKKSISKNWLCRLLTSPWYVFRGIYRFLEAWMESVIFYITWPIALFIGVFTLGFNLVWLVTLFPVRKYYEWLILRAEELRWSSRLTWLLGLKLWQRWLIWFITSIIYLTSITSLYFNGGSGYVATAFSWAFTGIFIGLLVLGVFYPMWESWRKRRLRKHMPKLPIE